MAMSDMRSTHDMCAKKTARLWSIALPAGSRLHVEVRGAPEDRFYRRSEQRLTDGSRGDGLFQHDQRFPIRRERMGDVGVRVGKAHVVEAAPENPPRQQLLLHERFHLERVAGLRVERHQ